MSVVAAGDPSLQSVYFFCETLIITHDWPVASDSEAKALGAL